MERTRHAASMAVSGEAPAVRPGGSSEQPVLKSMSSSEVHS
jgi:hypothetical protein